MELILRRFWLLLSAMEMLPLRGHLYLVYLRILLGTKRRELGVCHTAEAWSVGLPGTRQSEGLVRKMVWFSVWRKAKVVLVFCRRLSSVSVPFI